jgi:hypothetical protein
MITETMKRGRGDRFLKRNKFPHEIVTLLRTEFGEHLSAPSPFVEAVEERLEILDRSSRANVLKLLVDKSENAKRLIVGLTLVLAIGTDLTVNLKFTKQADYFPFIGMAVLVAILLSIPVRRPNWEVLPEAFKGSIFLLSRRFWRLHGLGWGGAIKYVSRSKVCRAMVASRLVYLGSVRNCILRYARCAEMASRCATIASPDKDVVTMRDRAACDLVSSTVASVPPGQFKLAGFPPRRNPDVVSICDLSRYRCQPRCARRDCCAIILRDSLVDILRW